MKRLNLWVAAALLPVLMLLWGCEPNEPGSPLANQPPTTRIVVAPLMADTSYVYNIDSTAVIDTIIVEHHPDHYASTSPMFHVQWFGNDPDGTVEGYYVSVDGGTEVWTTRGDSLISFQSSTPDPNDPTRMLAVHTLRVAAADNEGLKDPTPATQTFESINYPPEITDFVATFPEGANVGAGIAFSVEASDPNPSGLLFQLLVDTAVVAPWDTRGSWQFCKTGDATILDAINQGTTQAVDIARLPTGPHTLKVEVADLGGATATPESRVIVVVAAVAPIMSAISSTYGAADYYDDGSIFYRAGTTTSFTMSGDAGTYFGGVANFQFRYRTRAIPETPADTVWSNWGAWSAWGGASFTMDDLPVGQYEFEAKCRDFTGTESEALSYQASIVEPEFDQQTLLLVDKTVDGNGRPGSPNDAQVDDFYRAVTAGLTGWEDIKEVDYRAVGYLSPLQLYDRRVVIFYTDDQSGIDLTDATLTILGEYLDLGGRMLFSGWDLINAFTPDTASTQSFNKGFVFKYLRCTTASRNNNKDFTGFTGVTNYGYADVEIDHAKLPGSWVGLAKCWKLTPAWRADGIGLWSSAGHIAGFEGENCVVRNISPVNAWRTITLGFPLYFMNQDQAKVFMEKAIADLNE